jgi:hypothetical protein
MPIRSIVRHFLFSIKEFIESRTGITHNEQGLLQGWNSLLVSPEPLLIKDIKVQVNKQKPGDVCPARMMHNSDMLPISPTSRQTCSKPHVVCCTSRTALKHS